MGFYATGDVQAENRYYPVFHTHQSEKRLTTIESLAEVPDQAKVRLEFTYDYIGRRVTKTVLSGHDGSVYQQTNEVTFVYDGWNLIAALDEDLVAGSTSTNFYLWGLDLSGTFEGSGPARLNAKLSAGGVGGLLATTQDGASYFACMDGNGNVMALVDASDGTLAGEYEYGPFGEPLKALGDAAEDNAVRFSSKYTDTESGLLYYGYRYLDPNMGRWPSRDPIGESGAANPYCFLENQTVDGWDYLGLDPQRQTSSDQKPAAVHPNPEEEARFQRILKRKADDQARKKTWTECLSLEYRLVTGFKTTLRPQKEQPLKDGDTIPQKCLGIQGLLKVKESSDCAKVRETIYSNLHEPLPIGGLLSRTVYKGSHARVVKEVDWDYCVDLANPAVGVGFTKGKRERLTGWFWIMPMEQIILSPTVVNTLLVLGFDGLAEKGAPIDQRGRTNYKPYVMQKATFRVQKSRR